MISLAQSKAILQDIQNFFGVGKISVVNNTATYRVVSLKDLKVIIDQFPLIFPQLVTFNEWSKVDILLEAKAHLKSKQTFNDIVNVYAGLGRGASSEAKIAFPRLSPITLPDYKLPVTVESLNS